MRILITGGAGFIGSHLARRLLDQGNQVIVIDNFSTGRKENVPAEATLVQVDISRSGFLDQLPRGPYDAVCHLAAQSSGEVSGENPLYDLQTNAVSTLLLSQWCVQQKIPRFLYASSMAIYGNVPADQLPVCEDRAPAPLSYYGISKMCSEQFLRLAQPQLSSTSFRMFSVYGPGQNLANLKQGMISIYLAYLLKGEKLRVTGSLERYRDFIYIDDVIDAWQHALTIRATPASVYNLGSGHPTTVKTLLSQLFQALKLSPDYPVDVRSGSSSDQFGLYADIRHAKADLVWQPRIPLDEGLSRMVNWARKEENKSR